jgi:hypothetical protein
MQKLFVLACLAALAAPAVACPNHDEAPSATRSTKTAQDKKPATNDTTKKPADNKDKAPAKTQNADATKQPDKVSSR